MGRQALSTLRESLLEQFNDLQTVSRGRLMALEAELYRISQSTPAELPVVELGTCQGVGALWIRAVLDAYGQDSRELHVYDSFQGVPKPSPIDGEFLSQGDVKGSPEQVLAIFDHFSLKRPVIHEGWFSESLPDSLPNQIAWAYIDCDLYQPMLECLEATCPRVTAGGSILVDDYADIGRNPTAWDGLPGVYSACVEFFGNEHPLRVIWGGDNLPYGSWDKPHS